jgi:tetratricopeptide (TPR) repeat protein
MKRSAALILGSVMVFVLAGGAWAQSISDQLPSYVIGSFSRANYESLPVLRNLFTLESRMPEYAGSYKPLGLGIDAWSSGDLRVAREKLLDHAQAIGSLNRLSTTDGLILASLYFAQLELQRKLGGTPFDSSRAEALAYLAMGQADYYITIAQVVKSGAEDTRKALGYAIAVIEAGQKLAPHPGFYYYSALAHYLSAETYSRTDGSYFPGFNAASYEIGVAALMLPDCSAVRFLQAQIKQWVDPLVAIEASDAYMALVPMDPTAYFLRGRARFFAKQYDKSVEDLHKYLELAPKGALREMAEESIKSAQELIKLSR